jgi:hypothetical protein
MKYLHFFFERLHVSNHVRWSLAAAPPATVLVLSDLTAAVTATATQAPITRTTGTASQHAFITICSAGRLAI